MSFSWNSDPILVIGQEMSCPTMVSFRVKSLGESESICSHQKKLLVLKKKALEGLQCFPHLCSNIKCAPHSLPKHCKEYNFCTGDHSMQSMCTQRNSDITCNQIVELKRFWLEFKLLLFPLGFNCYVFLSVSFLFSSIYQASLWQQFTWTQRILSQKWKVILPVMLTMFLLVNNYTSLF